MTRRTPVLVAACVLAAASPLRAQQGQASHPPGERAATTPVRVDQPPVIDGHLDDAAWATAPVISGFVQREPVEGAPVSERTEVRILTDGEALYIGAWLFDSSPEGIIQGERIRDTDLERGDFFGIILDTYRDRQNGFIFSTTPAGIEYDAQVVKEGEGGGVFQRGQNRQQAGSMGGLNVNWDGSWRVATSQDGEGWYAEMRIPFSTLRYASGGDQVWGMNLVRRIRRRNEESFWSPVSRQFNLMRLSQAGDLQGLSLPVQRSATVTPFALGSVERTYAAGVGTNEYPREVGGDAKVTLGSVTLDFTVNTDFAQVEVDEQRTNLTR
ncbi:MAG TPA: carbohydrate binding family 9 domain-containing protein, partial [Longimicrobiales bacterium]|nr:carbohydrate binding family 9 domain-containing protein [Longimicrobiales bacterium]